MKLILENDQSKLTFNKPTITLLDVTMAYKMVTGEAPVPQKVVEPEKPKPVQQPVEMPVVHKEKQEQPDVKPRPKAIELLNSERALNVPIEESGRIQRENVKVYVHCPLCFHEADQWTYRGNRFTKCRGCNERLFLTPAGEDWGDVDEYGYEYNAFKEYFERNEGNELL